MAIAPVLPRRGPFGKNRRREDVATMAYAYILRSEKDGKLYYGSTEDLGSRLKAHNAGKV